MLLWLLPASAFVGLPCGRFTLFKEAHDISTVFFRCQHDLVQLPNSSHSMSPVQGNVKGGCEHNAKAVCDWAMHGKQPCSQRQQSVVFPLQHAKCRFFSSRYTSTNSLVITVIINHEWKHALIRTIANWHRVLRFACALAPHSHTSNTKNATNEYK